MKKNYTISLTSSELKIFLVATVAFCFIAIIGGILIVDKIVMPRIVGNERDIIKVPSIAGLHWEEGREKLYAVGLLTEIKSREYDSKIAPEYIISQMPEPGAKVKKGRRIGIVLSRGKEIATIPDVRKLTERAARIELKKNGFTLGKVKKVYADSPDVELVIDAFPQSGSTISREMAVDLIISKGPKPTHAEVPNIVGESLTEAKKTVEDAGLLIGKIEYKDSPSLLPGTVISQSVPPGESAPLESKIDIEVSIIK